MTNAPKPLTASAIKYLLILLELCKNETGARCMDIAGQLHVTKPSVHSMIGNLCSAGLAEKKKYGNVFLTPAGRAEAERYAGCCQQLSGRMQQSLGLNAEDAYSASGTIPPRHRNTTPSAVNIPPSASSFAVLFMISVPFRRIF